MIQLTLHEAAQILSCHWPETETSFTGVSIDSRSLLPNQLFVAIQGENFDGHDFVKEAILKKAAAVIVSKRASLDFPTLCVPNTIHALGQLAAAWRNRFKIPVVAITGSNGKTTSKNLVASILSEWAQIQDKQILATEGNFNNDIGLPLNLLKLNDHHLAAVLEMGMNHFGEIAYLTQIANPTIALITNAGAGHLEGLKTIENVAKAKGELIEHLSGIQTVILNADDPNFSIWNALSHPHRKILFGLTHQKDIFVTHVSYEPTQTHCQITTPKETYELTIPLPGEHNVRNALGAIAVAYALDIPTPIIQTGILKTTPAKGRLQRKEGWNHCCLIDDTYNANPVSVPAAFSYVHQLPQEKWCVLGDMKELGDQAQTLHEEMGTLCKKQGFQRLFTIGTLSRFASQSFGTNGIHFESKTELIEHLKTCLNKEIVLLIKGSRSMKMEEVVQGLMSH